MATEGWYYLHTNGELIYKGAAYTSIADFRESDLVRAFWPCDPEDRETGWRIVVESLAAGANPERVRELAEEWGCTDEDAEQYADRLGLRLFMDGDQWCAVRADFYDLGDSPAGFGHRAYEALAELAKELGYVPAKMWGPEFARLAR